MEYSKPMNEAISLARSLLGEQRYCIGSVITDRQGKILSSGQNSYVKTHPTQAMWAHLVEGCEKIYLHAEMEAMIKNNNNARANTIYVARVRARDGKIALSRPCKTCSVAILKATNIETVVYTKDDGTIDQYHIDRS